MDEVRDDKGLPSGSAEGPFSGGGGLSSVIFAGSGGQGVLLVGTVLAQAAMLEGKNVTWFPSYGAEMRGGTANCTVVISEDFIGSPIVAKPDCLVAMNNASVKA